MSALPTELRLPDDWLTAASAAKPGTWTGGSVSAGPASYFSIRCGRVHEPFLLPSWAGTPTRGSSQMTTSQSPAQGRAPLTVRQRILASVAFGFFYGFVAGVWVGALAVSYVSNH